MEKLYTVSKNIEYWSGLPFPSPGDLPGPGIEPGSPALQGFMLVIKETFKHQDTEMIEVKRKLV